MSRALDAIDTTANGPDPARSGRRPERRPVTVDELVEIARPGKSVVAQPDRIGSRSVTTSNFSPVDDPITPDDCADFYSNVPEPPPPNWYKNRFNACFGEILRIRRVEVRNGRPVEVSAMQVKAMFLISMNKDARTAKVTVDLFDWYDPAGNFPTNQRLNFGSGCWDPDPSGPECNPGTVSHDDTIAGWQTNSRRETTVAFSGTSTPRPDDPALNEQRSFYQFNPYWYIDTGIPREQDFLNWPQFNLRCDIARTAVNAQYARGSDCVFHEASGIFQLSLSDPLSSESVRFLKDAMDDITLTKPGTPGTFVPGKNGTAHPLSRLYYDNGMRNANRAKSIATCQQYWGVTYPQRPDGQTNDCDEYPFATTHQGSYSASGTRSYAVRPLLNLHNQKVGSYLAQFTAEDHILEEDTYYVLINN